MNKWNTLRVAMYGACLGLLYAAFLEIGLWAQVDMYGQAGGGLIGGTIVGGILDHRFHETGLMHGIHLASEAL
jgi:hypothetical protein